MDTPKAGHTGLSPEIEQRIRERFPVELNGAELAALANTFSFALASAQGQWETAKSIFPEVIAALSILGYEPATTLMFTLSNAAADRMRDIGDVAIVNSADIDRSAVLGGSAATNIPGGIIS